VGRTGEGLPVGIQIVAAPFEDHTALEAARMVEQVLGGFTPPPAFA